VQDITQSLMSNGPLAVQAAKAALDGGVGQTVEAALQIEAECYERIVVSSDRLEALQAFAEKRKPRFEGR
jgi:enoyl-CoA hydratase/carnithine racemase